MEAGVLKVILILALDWIGVIAFGVLMGWYAANGIAQ
jgi:hypothetical protein